MSAITEEPTTWRRGGEGRVADPLARQVRHRSLWAQAWRAFRRDRVAVIALALLLLVCLAAVFAPMISPYPPNEANNRLRLYGIGTSGHPLGLDEQGRDVLSRLIWGGRISLPTALLPTAIAALASLVLGLAAGFYGGILGGLIMRVMDVFFAFPVVILAIGIAGILGPSLTNVMLSLTVVLVPYITRIVYAATLEVSGRDFLEAARAGGATGVRQMFVHVLPNVLPPLIVYSTTIAGLLVVYGSGLSYLGLGVQPPTADWGMMAASGRDALSLAPHVSTIPGIVILLVALSFNLIGDGLRDALDPRSRVREVVKVAAGREEGEGPNGMLGTRKMLKRKAPGRRTLRTRATSASALGKGSFWSLYRGVQGRQAADPVAEASARLRAAVRSGDTPLPVVRLTGGVSPESFP